MDEKTEQMATALPPAAIEVSLPTPPAINPEPPPARAQVIVPTAPPPRSEDSNLSSTGATELFLGYRMLCKRLIDLCAKYDVRLPNQKTPSLNAYGYLEPRDAELVIVFIDLAMEEKSRDAKNAREAQGALRSELTKAASVVRTLRGELEGSPPIEVSMADLLDSKKRRSIGVLALQKVPNARKPFVIFNAANERFIGVEEEGLAEGERPPLENFMRVRTFADAMRFKTPEEASKVLNRLRRAMDDDEKKGKLNIKYLDGYGIHRVSIKVDPV